MPHLGPPTEYEINYSRDRHVPLTEDQKIQVGRDLFEFFISKALDFPLDYPPTAGAINWLRRIGFDRVEWVEADFDILLCLLWRYDPGDGAERVPNMTDEFIIEFAGTDAAVITVFNKGKEWSG